MISKDSRQRTLATVSILCAIVLAAIGTFLFVDGDAQGGWLSIGASAGILSIIGAGLWISRRK